MKKYLLPILLIPSILYALPDTLTTGSLKLLRPSITTADPNRTAGDKLNANFQIIDSSVTGALNQLNALATSTTTALNRINALTIDTTTLRNDFNTHNSTNDAVLTAIAVATTTLGISSQIIVNQESPDISNRTFYLHDETTGTVSVYRLLSSSPSALPEVQRTVNVPVGPMVSISSFITTGGDPGVRKIPAGVWSFTTWGQVASIVNSVQMIVTVSTTDFAGNGAAEVLSSTSAPFLDLGIDRFDLVAVQTADLFVSTSQRILVQYFAKSASALGINTSLFYAGTSRFSHLTTPIGAVYKLTQLTDHPSTLIGQRGKVLMVNDEETATFYSSTGTSSSGGGVINSTNPFTIKITGNPVLSTSVPSALPGGTWTVGVGATRTVFDLQAFCTVGSTVGGVTFQLRHSSANFYGSPWKFDTFWGDMITSTITKNGDRYVSPPIISSSSLLWGNDYFWVAITSMPQSGQPPSECGITGHYWERNQYSP